MQSLISPSSLHHNYINNNNNKPTLSLLPRLSFISNNKPKSPFSQFSSSPSACIVHAVENDSQKFEIDPDEAKQALQKLDQQLQTLSKKRVSSPKIKAANVKLTRDQAEEQTFGISGSFLTYTAVGLLIFTIFYNVLFYGVIKPSIDGPDDVPAPAPVTSRATESTPNAAVLQSLPPILEDPVQR